MLPALHCIRYQQPGVGRYEKFHMFAKSCWNGIPNSCNDLINIKYVMRKYGSLKPQMVIINLLVAKYA